MARRRKKIPDVVRRHVAEVGKHRCGYCLTVQEFTAMPMQVEHIIPIAAGGSDEENNLWLAWPLCNGAKAAQVTHIDPFSKEVVSLFNPRTQIWLEHFSWSEDGTEIVGETSTGRATVIALNMNNIFLLQARRRWVMVGWHPPTD